jgi:hypothetical protein
MTKPKDQEPVIAIAGDRQSLPFTALATEAFGYMELGLPSSFHAIRSSRSDLKHPPHHSTE